MQVTTGFLRRGNLLRPRFNLVLNSNLNRLTRRVASTVTVPCRRVPCFPVSAIRKRGNRLICKGLDKGGIVTVRKHFRFCRKCKLRTIAFPVEMVGRLNIRSLTLAGTTNNVDCTFAPKSLVLVASRVGLANRGPLVKPGSPRRKPHFASVDRTCSTRCRTGVGRITSRVKLSLGRNICLKLANPACRAPTRVQVYHMLKTSTINVSAIPRTVITHRTNLHVFNVSYVAGLTSNVRTALGRRRIIRAAAQIGRAFGALLGGALATLWRANGCGIEEESGYSFLVVGRVGG